MPNDSIQHRAITVAGDTASLSSDSVHIPRWRFDNLEQVPGMYMLDSIPALKLNGFHKKVLWKNSFDDYAKQTDYFHEELPATREGEIGIPIEYSISNDSVLSLALLMCVLFSILMVARSWRFTCFQLKNLFRTPRESSIRLRETSSEMRYQTYFSLIGVVMLSLFAYTTAQFSLKDGEDFSVGDYQLIGIYFTVFLIYRGLCEVLEAAVLPVYFTKIQRMIWAGNRIFLIALQGALLLPLSLIMIYLHLDMEKTITIVASVVAVTFLMRIYKAYCIFFRKDGALLQFFLYLCTLKAVPLALVVGISLFIANYLKINI